MISLQLLNVISIVVFCILLFVLLWRDRDNIERQSIIFMRRTKHGIELLDGIAGKFPRFWKVFSTIGIVVAFGAMIFIFYFLINNALNLFLIPNTQPALALVLPSPLTSSTLGPGYFAIPFWYWIISIATVVVAHEMMHGIVGRNEGFNIKSVGWVIIGIIPGAFVEPDGEEGVLPGQKEENNEEEQEETEREEKEENQGPWQQGSWISRLRVLAAGSFSNLCLGAILFVVLLLVTTSSYGLVSEPRGIYDHHGVEITAIRNNTNAYRSNLAPGDVIKSVNGHEINYKAQWSQVTRNYSPGDTVVVRTQNKSVELTLQNQLAMNYTYSPAPVDYVLAKLELMRPGSITSYEQSNNWLVAENKLHRFYRWQWVADNYPQLEARAKQRMEQLRQEILQTDNFYLGINVNNYRLPRVNKLLLPIIGFIKGLLVFMMAINLGIGMANMLPVKPLDGGLMIETLQQRFWPERDNLTKHVTYITSAIIIIIVALTISNLL